MKSSLVSNSFHTSASEAELGAHVHALNISGDGKNIQETHERKKSIFIISFVNEKFAQGSVPQGSLSLIAATIGTGILMISDSLAPSGIIWSVIQMLFCAVLTYYTLVTLIKCAEHTNAQSYQELSLIAFGDKFRHVFNFFNYFANWGSVILFLQLACELVAVVTAYYGKDQLPEWLTDQQSKPLIVLIATLFMLPLSLPKEFKALQYFTFVNLCLLILFCYAVIYEGFEYEPIGQSFSTVTMFNIGGFSTTFPSAVFTMTSHTNAIDIFRELKYPTLKNMKKVIIATIAFTLTALAVVGIIGYATFSGNINILSGSDYANSVIVVAYGYTLNGTPRAYPIFLVVNIITMCASVIISQPFNVKPSKDSLRNSFRTVLKRFGYIESDESTDPESRTERYLYVIATLYSAVLVVLFSDSAQMVMNISGSSFFCLLCFVFPSLFYLKIFKDTITKNQRILHWVIAIGNVGLAIWATAGNIIAIA